MILGFTQHINKKRNFFVRKIWLSIVHQALLGGPEESMNQYTKFVHDHLVKFGQSFENPISIGSILKPKYHTIRSGNRWKVGMMIDFYINTRTKKMFRFAPRLPCCNVQIIEIKWFESMAILSGNLATYNPKPNIYALINIDGKQINHQQIHELAINDGFDSVDEFFAYFDKNFQGQLIHWTLKTY